MPPRTEFNDQEKDLVQYFKDKLVAQGVQKFPRNWHLLQLSVARHMLAGDKAPSTDDWGACVDWCFEDKFWKDKIDHLARVETLWTKFCLQGGRKAKEKKDKFSLLYM